MKHVICINGRFLTKPIMGVFRYAIELLNKFDKLLDEKKYHDISMICLVPPESIIPPNWKNIIFKRVGINTGNIWEQIDLPFCAGGQLLFSPANSGPFYYANQAVTLHDASVFGIPAAYTALYRAKNYLISKKMARSARLLLTDSIFSQTELSHYLGVPASRFHVIYLGGDHLGSTTEAEDYLGKYNLQKNSYMLGVASQSLHKNFSLILTAAEVYSSKIEFAAAGGSYETVFQKSEKRRIPSNVRLLGYVSDNELKSLYKNAMGFVFPSLYEGFGLPVLEAMNLGCPVLCSNAASLPEIGGDAVLYFDPMNKDDLIKKLSEFISSPNLQEELREQGQKRASEFTWEKTARATLDVLETLL